MRVSNFCYFDFTTSTILRSFIISNIINVIIVAELLLIVNVVASVFHPKSIICER